MTRIALAAFFILLQQFAFAQRGAGKYWVAEKPRYAERSFSTLLIEKVERTPQFTVVTMSFTNKNKDETLISICNSFKLMSGGKKVASIVSTQNIPMYDVIKNGFRCAELPDAKLVRGRQVVVFQLYFTPLPEDVDFIDLIEYNGAKACEYDVYKVDISRKQVLSPAAIAAIASLKPSPNKQSTKAIPKIAKAKTPKPKAKVVESAVVAQVEEKRAFEVRKDIKTPVNKVKMLLWDDRLQDGDVVSLKLNGKWLYKNVPVLNKKAEYLLQLDKGENILEIFAEDLGTNPPCTAAITLDDGISPPETLIMISDKDKSDAIRITVK